MGLKPTFRVTADGADVTKVLSSRLLELTITDNAGQTSDCLTLTLNNTDEKMELPRDGVELEAWIGYDDIVANMGTFIVDEVSIDGPPTVVRVSARGAPFRESRTFGSIQSQKTRSWHNVTFGAIAAKIAADHGMQVAIDATLAAKPIEHIDQTDESDIHLLTRLADAMGATAKPAGGRLVIVPRGAGKTAKGLAIPLIVIDREEVSRFGLRISKRARFSRVVAIYRDTTTARDVELEVGSGDPVCRLRYLYPNAATAGDAAKSRLGSYRRGAGVASVSMAGRTDLLAEGRVSFSGFPAGFGGQWQITSVTHTVSPSSGYTVNLEAETLAEGDSAAAADGADE